MILQAVIVTSSFRAIVKVYRTISDGRVSSEKEKALLAARRLGMQKVRIEAQ